jgi:hypothetical protein
MGHPHNRTNQTTTLDRRVPGAAALVSGCQPRLAVVGGSLTGPALALLLVQAGFDRVAVYEATPAAATLGGGLISLEHSALDVLDRAGVDQHEYVKAGFETITQTSRRGGADETVRRVYPGRFTTWTLLHRALTTHLPAGLIHYGRRVTGLAATRGGLLLRFADGDSEPADLVVFADGRASVGRRLLDPGRRLHYAGYVAHRGECPATLPTLATFDASNRAPACSSMSPRHRRAVTGLSTSTPPPPSTRRCSAPHHCGGSSRRPDTSAPPRGNGSTGPRPHTCRPNTPPSCTPPPPGWQCRSSTSTRPAAWCGQSAPDTPSCSATRWPPSGHTPPAEPTTASNKPPDWSPRCANTTPTARTSPVP